jgi:hypothetical protein
LDGLAIGVPSEVESLARVSTGVIVEGILSLGKEQAVREACDDDAQVVEVVEVCHGELEMEPLGNALE